MVSLIAIKVDRLNDTHYSVRMDDTLVSRSIADVEDGVNRLADRLCGAYQVISRSPEIGLLIDAVGDSVAQLIAPKLTGRFSRRSWHSAHSQQ